MTSCMGYIEGWEIGISLLTLAQNALNNLSSLSKTLAFKLSLTIARDAIYVRVLLQIATLPNCIHMHMHIYYSTST